MYSDTHVKGGRASSARRGPLVRPRPGGRGFSLTEIMVVVVIIGLLAGAVSLKVVGYMDDARVNRAKSDIATIVSAIENYQIKHGRFPSLEEGLEKLPLRNRVDPWGLPYEYRIPGPEGEPFEVFTLAADKIEGGEEANADIYSWQLDRSERED